MTQGPYAPPEARVADREIAARLSILKTTWGLLWRVLVLEIVILVPFATILGGAAQDRWLDSWYLWRPTAMYWLFAILLWLASVVTRRGCLGLIWGRRLPLTERGWRQATYGVVAFFGLLGVVNLLVAYFAPLQVWVNFKLFVVTPLLFAFTILLAVWLVRSPECLRTQRLT
jgi:intracellular septation protein A